MKLAQIIMLVVTSVFFVKMATAESFCYDNSKTPDPLKGMDWYIASDRGDNGTCISGCPAVMIRDLKNDGFKPVIKTYKNEDDGKIWKVIVSAPEVNDMANFLFIKGKDTCKGVAIFLKVYSQ